MADLSTLTDYQTIELFRRWSEQEYCAGFVTGPYEQYMERFCQFAEYELSKPHPVLDYEKGMLTAFRAHIRTNDATSHTVAHHELSEEINDKMASHLRHDHGYSY